MAEKWGNTANTWPRAHFSTHKQN